jgi:hypothetical protein
MTLDIARLDSSNKIQLKSLLQIRDQLRVQINNAFSVALNKSHFSVAAKGFKPRI